MWSAVFASVATIGVVFYMQGPIVALALTAASSLALLVAMKIGDKTQTPARQPKPLQVINGNASDADLLFPPLRRKAS